MAGQQMLVLSRSSERTWQKWPGIDKCGQVAGSAPSTPWNWPGPDDRPGGNARFPPRASCPKPRAGFSPFPILAFSLEPLAFAIYRAAMRNLVDRVPAETDCPGRGLGKTGGEALSTVTAPDLLGYRRIWRWVVNMAISSTDPFMLALLDAEATHNPEFAAKLQDIMAVLPTRSTRLPRPPEIAVSIPDVFAALQEKGEVEFGFWVRTLDVPTLKAVIRTNGFDPAKASQRWTDPDKFVGLVIEQTVSRMKRGSAFLPPKT